jgi:hypothetical protein
MLLRPGAGLFQLRQPTRNFFIRELREFPRIIFQKTNS